MGGEIGVKTVVYNAKRDKKKREKKKKKNRTKKEKREQKVEENTTVKRENTVLSIILLGHDRGYFLCLYMCNSF